MNRDIKPWSVRRAERQRARQHASRVLHGLELRGHLLLAQVIAVASGVELEQLVAGGKSAPFAAHCGRDLLLAILKRQWKFSTFELAELCRIDTTCVTAGLARVRDRYPELDELDAAAIEARGLPWGSGAVDARRSSTSGPDMHSSIGSPRAGGPSVAQPRGSTALVDGGQGA